MHDEYARSILLRTSAKPMSASELSEDCDMSRSTVYRRADELVEEGLLRSYTRPDPDGHHPTVYEATVSSVSFDIDDGELAVTVTDDAAAAGGSDDAEGVEAAQEHDDHHEHDDDRDDLADRWTQLWSGVRGEDA
nr:winged helix-turn-helix domain-containing protein [Haloarchaeobius amylolyticus]